MWIEITSSIMGGMFWIPDQQAPPPPPPPPPPPHRYSGHSSAFDIEHLASEVCTLRSQVSTLIASQQIQQIQHLQQMQQMQQMLMQQQQQQQQPTHLHQYQHIVDPDPKMLWEIGKAYEEREKLKSPTGSYLGFVCNDDKKLEEELKSMVDVDALIS